MQKHKDFCAKTKIRGGRGKFSWLQRTENANAFLPALQGFLLSLSVVGIACVVDRPGYVTRYKCRYHDGLWYMCKTTFCILVERAAKFADAEDRRLEIYFEEAGKWEDRRITEYIRQLKQVGNPFDEGTSGYYNPLVAEDYRRIVLGEPQRRTKNPPLVQIADLILYPMAKGGYAPDFYPYQKLKEAGKLIDCLVPEDEIPLRGIKYSCFDG